MKVDYNLIGQRLLVLKEQALIRTVVILHPGQFRINDLLDLYPRHKKWHSLSTGKRGRYFDLEDFVTGFFNPEFRKK